MFLPGGVRVGNQEIAVPRADLAGLHGARLALGDRLLQTPKIHWDRATGRGRPFYYFAYGAAVQRGRDRHADRRVQGRAGRHPARRRPLAQSGDRHRPDRGRLRPGHGLAHHRGAVVGRARAGCAPTRPAPTRSRPAPTGRGSSTSRCSRTAENREDDDLPLQGGRRAAADARRSRCCTRSRTRSRASPDHKLCPRLDPPATPERVLIAIERLQERAAAERSGAHDRAGPDPARAAGRAASRRCWCRSRRPRARRRARPAPRMLVTAERSARHDRRRPARVGGDRRARAACCASGEARAHARSCRSGPQLGQCCGGRVDARAAARRRGRRAPSSTAVEAREREQLPHGAAVRRRPCRPGAGRARWRRCRCGVRWIDGRADELPGPGDRRASRCVRQRAARWTRSRRRRRAAAFVVLTHSHALDFDDLRGGAAARRLRLSRPDRLAHQARAFERGFRELGHRRRRDRRAWSARSAAAGSGTSGRR